ncbi:TonB-dependent receptor [Christiangramia fulva]|uniref:TonB-dependent receptor n=1 Tax=Christiangramia fulva TaxID=2126553 RepID=A0A2R3Z598_9FLAO|nr:outer membrane beta-barrel family protein [Christiangramia fulva]AVR45441.1 TonB-dependent receptor [Christiangramia fulva]
MKLYLKINLFILSFLLSQFVLAQEGILKGSLLDQEEVTVPFATVAVMQLPDSTVVTGSTTDINGNFKIKAPDPGDYFLRFSAIGYSSTFSSRFKVESSNFSRDFGAIIIKEESTMLNEVMIETWRPKVEMKGGNLNVRVEGTALAAGSSAYEVLSRAPGVLVDQDGNFKLNGKNGVSIMIDGRLTYLSSAELKTLLEGMSAENIESIEVITNPSAKYDAEGSAGILNIHLKKNTLNGLNGSVYAGYEYNQIIGYNAGANLSYKKGKWNSFFNFDLRRSGRYRDQYMTRGFVVDDEPSAFLAQNARDSRQKITPSLRAGTDFAIDENNTIGIMADLSYQDLNNDWNSIGYINDYVNDQNTDIIALNNIQEKFGKGRLNVHYQGKLDTLGSILTANVDYVTLSQESNSSFDNHYSLRQTDEQHSELLFSSSISDYEIFSGRLDLSLPLSKSSQLEMGLKASDVVSDSDLNFYIDEEGGKVLDPSRSNQFRYEENIYAAYASFNSQLNETWNITAGLRMEETVAKGVSLTMNETKERDYLEFFPNLSIEQKVSDDYKINYSFNRRILRPDYERLNPFIFYIDPYTYVSGNPDLKPQINNSFQITQTFFKKYNLMLGYDIADNFIGEVPIQDPETNETAFAIRNSDSYKSLTATLVAPFQIIPEWDMTNTVVLSDQRYNISVSDTQVENKQFFYMFQSTQRLNLPLDLSVELNVRYEGPVAYNLYRIESRFGMDVGIKKSFLNDRLDVSLSADDIFKTMQVTGSSNVNGNTTFVDQYMGDRTISLNLRYKLSNKKPENEIRQQDLEELNRAGGK